MSHTTSNGNEYNLDTTGLSLAPPADDDPPQEWSKVRPKRRGLINDNQAVVDKRRFIRRVGADRRSEIRFDTEDRRIATQDRRACERHWQSSDRL